MTPRPATAGPRPGPRWLALSEASRVLGVDQTTLRRWSDAGMIQTLRTPGGHRRFREADLASFVHGRHSATARLADVIGVGGARLLPPGSDRRIRRQPWYHALRGREASAVGASCRTMMAALASYLAGGGPAARRRGEAAARVLGAQIAALGLSPAQATAAFVYFREAITASVARRLPLRADRRIHSIRRVEEYFNQAQISLMAAYGRRIEFNSGSWR